MNTRYKRDGEKKTYTDEIKKRRREKNLKKGGKNYSC